MTRRVQNSYLTPLDSTGAPLAEAGGEATLGTSNRGVFTLTLGTTYYVPIPVADAMWAMLHTQGDAAIILTSVTIEVCCVPDADVTDFSDSIGEWIPIPAALITSQKEGTGWTNTSDVIGSAGGNAGGGVQALSNLGARRARAKVVVGATGGEVRFTCWAKE